MVSLITSFIPWMIFFLFASPNYLETGIVIALISFFVFNIKGLLKRRIIDWTSCLFFIGSLVIYAIIKWQSYDKYALLIGNVILLLVMFVTYLINHPFTEQYLKEITPQIEWHTKVFKKINRQLTLIWILLTALNFLLTFIAVVIHKHSAFLDTFLHVLLIIIALSLSHTFPTWYRRKILQQGGVAQLEHISEINVLKTEQYQVAYRTIGQGSPMVLLMASNMTMHNWEPVFIEELAKKHQVYLFEYPGIGASNSLQNLDINSLSDFCFAFLKGLNLSSVSILGYGLGGWLAQKLAINHHDIIKNLILINSDFGSQEAVWPEDTVFETLATVNTMATEAQAKSLLSILLPQTELASVGPKIEKIYQSSQFEAPLTNTVIKNESELARQWYCGEGSVNQIQDLKQPTLIISGEKNKISPHQNALSLQAKIPHSELVTFPDGGFGLIYQHPLQLAETINTFLAKQNV